MSQDLNDSIDPFGSFPAPRPKHGRAAGAFVDRVRTHLSEYLYNRFLPILVTLCAKPMGWFGSASLQLQHKQTRRDRKSV